MFVYLPVSWVGCQSYLASNSEYIKQFCFLCFRYCKFPEHAQHAMRQKQSSDHCEARNIDNPDIVNSEMGVRVALAQWAERMSNECGLMRVCRVKVDTNDGITWTALNHLNSSSLLLIYFQIKDFVFRTIFALPLLCAKYTKWNRDRSGTWRPSEIREEVGQWL